MAPGAKRKSLDHAPASFPAPGGGGVAAEGGGGGGWEAAEVEGRDGSRRCPPPRSRRRRSLDSAAAIFEVRGSLLLIDLASILEDLVDLPWGKFKELSKYLRNWLKKLKK